MVPRLIYIAIRLYNKIKYEAAARGVRTSDGCEPRVCYLRRLCLGAAFQLGFVRMTGTTLDASDYVPNSVLRQIANAYPACHHLAVLLPLTLVFAAEEGGACAVAL